MAAGWRPENDWYGPCKPPGRLGLGTIGMKITRRDVFAGSAALAAATLSSEDAAAQSRAETLRQVTGNTINTLDLTMPGSTREAFGISMHTYDRLVAFGRKPVPGGFVFDQANIRGELAESYTVSPDGLKFTFKIRRDAKWHDGSPVTAADVKWSLDRHVTANSLAKAQLQIGSIVSPEQFTVIDPMTVQVTIDKPDRLTLMDLCVPYAIMINSTLAKKHATAEDPWAQVWMRENTAGGGAYTVETFKPGEQVVLRRNDAWKCGVDGKLPFFRRIIMPDRAGGGDPGQPDRARRCRPVDRPVGKRHPRPAAARQGEGRSPCRSPTASPISPSTPGWRPSTMPRSASAVAAALPYEDMFQASIFGRGARAVRRRPGPGRRRRRPSRSRCRVKTDLAAAKTLLTEAGFPNGFKTTFSFSAGLAATNEPVAALVKESLAKIGIEVEIQKMPDAQFNTLQAEKRCRCSSTARRPGCREPDYFFRLYFTRDQRWNFSNFNHPELNKLTEAAQFELDKAKYDAACTRMIAILAEEMPEVLLWQPNHEAVMAPDHLRLYLLVLPADRLPRPRARLSMAAPQYRRGGSGSGCWQPCRRCSAWWCSPSC